MSYLMEHGGESKRIEAKTNIPWTRGLLELTGLQAGMTALDLGCASGSTTRAMAQVTDPAKVTGVDLSEERLAFARERAAQGGSAIQYVQANGEALPFEDNTLDYAWSRFLFEYLKKPEAVLQEMIRVTRPGGKVVVGDLDGNCIYHYPLPEDLERGMKAVMAAAATVGFDPYVGRKLYTFFHNAGLQDIKVHPMPYHCFAGPIPEADQDNWFTKLKVLAPVGARALGSAETYAHFAQGMRDFLLRPDTFTYSTLLLVEGRVP